MRLAIRVDPGNPDHHLWNNNGTWWCHYTLEPRPGVRRRIRTSLETWERGVARARRDELLAALARISRDGGCAGSRAAVGREVASC